MSFEFDSCVKEHRNERTGCFSGLLCEQISPSLGFHKPLYSPL